MNFCQQRYFKNFFKKVLTNIKACDILSKSPKGDNKKVGADCGEGPPVPIPNTEVKLTCAEDTWRAAARENK